MFKLESYITPLLLSYVDKYIKNFRAEDSQVSLWGGDVSFNNLDLRLEVLENELNLPFTFVSGHIHELLIHVPWTKITSEPITITINTIECILKLKGSECATNTNVPEKKKRPPKQEIVEAPPSYIETVINKIIGNIRIYCNNLILKYVEEDIVLSMNVKLLTFESANNQWEPAYIDLPCGDVTIRKLIMINDLTICLDKRNASGKIEVYQEPVLYRCSMAIRLFRNYYTPTAKKTSVTKADIHCASMEFSMNEQQVPMIMRVIKLILALVGQEFKQEQDLAAESVAVLHEDLNDSKLTWAGWAWSIVPSVLPVHWDDDSSHDAGVRGHTMNFGFYVDNISFTFKVSEFTHDRGYYHQKKIKYWPVLNLNLQGVIVESVYHGKPWLNSTLGVSQILLHPVGYCTCAQIDIFDADDIQEYLKVGSYSEKHLLNSLFDENAPENRNEKRKYQISWENYIQTKTDKFLLQNTPAIAIDFVHYVQIPDDVSLSDLIPNQDYLNFKEHSLLRVIVGPLRVNLCSGFFHRISSLKAAISAYDYQPYTQPKPSKSLQELPPPTEDDFDAFNEHISMKVTQITIINPVVEIELMDHPYFVATKQQYFRPRKRDRVSTHTADSNSAKEVPKLTVECQAIEAKFTNPYYENKLVTTTCQLPDAPAHMFNACHNEKCVKVIGISSRLILSTNRKYTTLVTPTNATYCSKAIIFPEYWLSNDIVHQTITYESDAITLTGTNPKLTLAYHILDKLAKLGIDETYGYIKNSSLFEDASRDISMTYLELCLESVKYKKILTNSTRAYEIKIGSLKSFLYHPIDVRSESVMYATSENSAHRFSASYATRDIEQVMFLSSSESYDPANFINLTIQLPLNSNHQPHAPIVIFNVQELKICLDPLFCKWLLYTPTFTLHRAELTGNLTESYQRKLRNLSDLSLLETPKKTIFPESVHSSSEKEHVIKGRKHLFIKEEGEKSIDIQERTYNFLKTWYDVWKGLILFGDIQQCVIYFPIQSLSAVGSKGMDETVEQAVQSDKPAEILVIKLPNSSITSNVRKKSIMKLIHNFPIKVPGTLWRIDSYSFPWTVSITDMNIYTLQFGRKLNVLKQTSISATVALSINTSNVSEAKVNVNPSQTGSIDVQQSSQTSLEIETMGLCVYVDISPILMYFSEAQIYLLSSILYGITEVIFNRMASPLNVEKPPDVASSHQVVSPLLLSDSVHSVSETLTSDTLNAENSGETQKLTAWIQSTINKATVSILTHKQSDRTLQAVYKELPNLKLVFDAEDIVSSLDFQNVYLKVKNKIGTATVRHYEKKPDEDVYIKGPFLGLIMRARDSILQDKQEDTCFSNFTITRANCRHTHNLWGTFATNKKDKDHNKNRFESPSRFITEIVFTLQPIDFILPPTILSEFLSVFQPLTQIKNTFKKSKKKYKHKLKINSSTLPLAYFELKGFQFVFPITSKKPLHDMSTLQIDNIILNPSPENPICRIPVRSDLYEKAAQARILNIPGSDLEDRQYQLEINGISFSTGNWKDFSKILKSAKSESMFRTMSENPALEWNNMAQKRAVSSSNLRLWPFVEKFNMMIIAAPAIEFKRTLVCNHSIEINFVSDINLNVSLSHINFITILMEDISDVIAVTKFYEDLHPKVIFPYETCMFLPVVVFDENDSLDSGYDNDNRSSISLKDVGDTSRIHVISENDSFLRVVSKPILFSFADAKVSTELLIAAGKVSLIVCDLLSRRKSIIKSEVSNTNFEPILYMRLSQPNAYLSDSGTGPKIQISCFDVCVKINGSKFEPTVGIPTEGDFRVNILETRSGEPNEETGILPALLTMKWSKGVTNISMLEIEMAKPTKILFSVERCEYLLLVYSKFLEAFTLQCKILQENKKEEVECEPQNKEVMVGFMAHRRLRFYDQYERFKEIKNTLRGLSYVNIQIAQVVVVIQTSNGIELAMCIGDLNHNITVNNRPERVIFVLKYSYLTLGISTDTWKKLILNPWSLSAEVCFFWDPWQDEDSDPQIQVAVESDTIMIDISPNQIKCIGIFLKEAVNFLKLYFPEDIEISAPVKTCVSESNQYYKDDLRAGAFQFIDAHTTNLNELPMPYQVMFWSKNASVMAWRYPQPRVLTKVRVFPVPFKVTTGESPAEQILCHLEYWSDSYNGYQPYAKFYLSESEMCHLDLPFNEPKPIIAYAWRVLLTARTPNGNGDNGYTSTRVPISPHVLAGCIRIDSYFSRALVPDLIMIINVSSINVSLNSDFDKEDCCMPECLQEYNCDVAIPVSQVFLTFHIHDVKAYLSSWNLESIMLDTNADFTCSILDYAFLTNQTLIEPFNARIRFSYAQKASISVASKPIRLKFGASAAHSLFVSAQLWNQAWKIDDPNFRKEFVIVTPYAICNNCNIPLRFGQTGYEEIYLPTRYCHMYSWRSQKCKKMLRVGMQDDNFWVWSEPFNIDDEGTQMLKMGENLSTIIVTVKALSATQFQVIFSGQFCIYNMLLEHFEFKVVDAVHVDKDHAFKSAQSYIINGKSSPPAILLNTKKKHYLRLRFFGLDSAWSGDIPLAENTKSAQPWLVKVPLQERGQFLSIWCKIVVQQYPKGCKVLAMLWPLFMIRSNLPVTSKIQIETPSMNVHLESTVRGKGEHQQLYCPGTIDHSHQITLQLDDTVPTLNPYVPLSYSLVDQKTFFKRPENCDIDEIIDSLKQFEKSDWPYFNEELNINDFSVGNQPLTHVQVKYQNACEYSSTLLVELLPWCLLLNTLGCEIGIIINEQEICRVAHYGLVTPPKLEETFHIGVGLGKTWNMSLPLQLAKSEWGQVFYMPKITGTIPLEGNIKTAVKCGSYICFLSLNSSIKNEIRLLKVCSTHMLTNNLKREVHVVCFAIPDTKDTYDIPSQLEKHSFTISPDLNTAHIGVSIVQWYSIGGNSTEASESSAEFAFYVAFSTSPKNGWSCPVRVDKGLIRRSITLTDYNSLSIPVVLTCNELEGQHLLSLHHDKNPQLEIWNHSGIKLFFAQCHEEEKTVVKDCEHLNWICSVPYEKKTYYTLPLLSEKFPEVQTITNNNYIVIASDPEGDPQGFQWSNPISITVREQFVRIPFFGDVKILSSSSMHTTTLSIDSIAQTEINAQDIRVRLSQHEILTNVSSEESNELMDDAVRESLTQEFGTAQASGSGTSVSSSYHTADDVNLSEIRSLQMNQLSTLFEVNTGDDMSSVKSPISIDAYDVILEFKVSMFLQSVIFVLTSDLENSGIERTEVAALICDNVALQIRQKDECKLSLYINEIQVDNQMYQTGMYDFSVIMIGQEARRIEGEMSIHMPIEALIEKTKQNPLFKLETTFERFKHSTLNKTVTYIKDVRVCIMPLAMYIEDVYTLKLLELLSKIAPNKLIIWSKQRTPSIEISDAFVKIPTGALMISSMLANPIHLSSLYIDPVVLSLSVHSSKKLYIALDQSPLQFAQFERKGIITTSYRLGHTLTMHYLSGAIFGAGWVVGSLELLGSPGGLARAMGTGLKDFVSMPWYGLVQGPWAFLKGVTHGSASLMKHITAGTLQSVTKLASSVARNLDRLTLDEEHLRRTEEQRRHKPQGLTQGFLQGLTGLGISLLGAIGGIAHHPLQSMVTQGASTSNLITGVGLGIVGIFTKPLSGAADLVALTGQGLLQGAGWNPLPQPRMNPVSIHMYSSPNTVLKYSWKYGLTDSDIIYATEGTCIASGQYESVALILTLENLIIANLDEDMAQRTLQLTELSCSNVTIDPTLITLKLKLPTAEEHRAVTDDDDVVVEMDPTSRARVADYVRNTVGILHFPGYLDEQDSFESTVNMDATEQILSFYVNPSHRNYFLCLLEICKQQKMKYNFPIY